MAFSKGQKRDAEISVKRYIGIAAVKVLGVNPTAAEQNKFFDTQAFTEDPEYVSKVKVKAPNGTEVEVPQTRITFIVKTNPAIKCNSGIDLTTSVTFFITRDYVYGDNGKKLKVMDKYGRTAWVTGEEFKTKAIPVYKNGPAKIDPGYHALYKGEEELVAFLKTYLGIPNPETWNKRTEKYEMKPESELPDCECSLDKIEDYFKGNVSEIKEILTYQPENMVKVLLGVRTTDEGKQFQAAFTRLFVGINNTDYSKLSNEVSAAQAAGVYKTTAFEIGDLKEFRIEATDYTKADAPAADTSVNDLPFANPMQ